MPTRPALRALALAAASFALAACSPAAVDPVDAGPEAHVPDAGAVPDAGFVDAGPTSSIGAPCETSADCAPTEGAQCLTEAQAEFRGGYCDYAPGCETHADCPDGSHCAYIQGGSGYCVKSCARPADCRSDGYACADFDEDGRTECDRSGTGPGAVGAACRHYWDCAGGIDADCASEARDGDKDGFCFIHRCKVAADCPTGSHCGLLDATTHQGSCLPTCTAAAGCRDDGYGCFDADSDGTSECQPAGTGTHAVGAACAGIWECAGGARATCLRAAKTDHKDGYCTLSCSATDACPTGSHCGNKDGGGVGQCQADCAATADCRGAGYVCADADGDGAKECAAAGTGSGAIGAACSGVWDCAGGVYASCLSETFDGMPGGYCSIYCLDDGRCGSHAHCAYIGDSGGYCFANCTSDSSCRAGYVCDDGDLDDVTECSAG